MGKARLHYSILLFICVAVSAAQTSVRQIEIKSGWGGLGTPRSAHLIIKRIHGEYRLDGKRIDPQLIEQLVSALTEPPLSSPDPRNLGITPEWCKKNAAEIGENIGSVSTQYFLSLKKSRIHSLMVVSSSTTRILFICISTKNCLYYYLVYFCTNCNRALT